MKILLNKILFQETGDIQHLRVHTDTKHSGQTFRVTKCQNKVIFQSLKRLMSDSSDLEMKGHLNLRRNSLYHIVPCVSILYIVNCVRVQCRLQFVCCSVEFSVFSAEYSMYSVQCSVEFSVFSAEYRVYTVKCSVEFSVFSAEYSVYTVYCSVVVQRVQC